MARMFYDNDADLSELEGLKLCVLGYGSQGRGQALNLRDSGLDVTVGLRKDSPSFAKAEAEGMKCASMEDALTDADLVAMLVPDTAQAKLYRDFVAPRLKPEACLLFSHGFNVHYKQVKAPRENDVVMVAPKGPGNLVREVFQ
ncbi:MAG: NAD(P)-binding domain-containing protein, partial [Planctomycetes bacterium]|nr:NAD(P)-binding domain-containing protein [Planctomycetota bacterium]